MNRSYVRVIKVGGSLLEWPPLPQRLTAWLASRVEDGIPHAQRTRPRFDVLIAGGGTLVDHIRQLDQHLKLTAAATHWMSVSAMSCTARLLADRLGTSPPIHTWKQLQSCLASTESKHPIVFDVEQFLQEIEPHQQGERLTSDWNSTSDSIAARLAQTLAADEFVLMKSTELDPSNRWQVAAEANLVDRHFPQLAAALPKVVWINLRST